MKKTVTSVLAMLMVSTTAYTGVGVVASVTGMQDAHAKRMGSSRSSFSRPASRPSTPTPAMKPQPATPAPSSIGSNVKPASAPTATSPAKPFFSSSRSSVPPVNRTYHSTPAQRSSAGSMVGPFLMGAGGAIAGSMLYSWLTSPTAGAAHAATPPEAAATPAKDGLNIIKPEAKFKIFEGANIPAEFQTKMKANGVTVEPKTGAITEYSKTIKVKGGVDVKIDVAELPVLVVYENEAGKPTHDLYMPM